MTSTFSAEVAAAARVAGFLALLVPAVAASAAQAAPRSPSPNAKHTGNCDFPCHI